MSGKTVLYLIVVLYIVSQVARCDLASTLTAAQEDPSRSWSGGAA